jgi:hypothetical protein
MSERAAVNSLRALANRLRDDPRYMAHALAAYQQQEKLSDDEFAKFLGTPPELVVRLAMCLRPEADSPRFAEQLSELADFTLADEAHLAHVLRQVDGLEKLATLHAAAPAEVEAQADVPSLLSLTGLLAVARDREDEAAAESRTDELSAAEDSAADEGRAEND